MNRCLVFGGSGQLGSAVLRLLPEAVAPTRSEVDVTDRSGLMRFLDELNPPCIINCAAYTDVDGAEADAVGAQAVNATAVGDIADFAHRRSAGFVTFSTDYVFDGTSDQPYVESSVPKPLNEYGRSKLAGETMALQYSGSLVIRTSWLLSTTHESFATKILSRAADGPVSVVSDQHGCPTFAEDLAAGTLQALEAGARGVLHLAGSPATSWHGLASAALKAAGLDPGLAVACASSKYPTRAERPRRSVLGSERLDSEGLEPLAPWSAGLPDLVAAARYRRQ